MWRYCGVELLESKVTASPNVPARTQKKAFIIAMKAFYFVGCRLAADSLSAPTRAALLPARPGLGNKADLR
jgi:hypothetical protein